ncbi:MAG: hypothetical protein IT462_09055 [Planctomycetes bacterium]|nr:hypothetical protein [Planctomycetota bacterium]
MRKTRAFAVLLIIGALVALWIFLAAPRAARNVLNEPPVDEVASALQPPGKNPTVRPSPDRAPQKTTDKPPALDRPEDPFMLEQPLWKPDYGDKLKRAGCKAEFEVRDAKGNPPDVENFFYVDVWRKLGSYYSEEQGRLDKATGKIICDGWRVRSGEQGVGLEPGDYEVHACYGKYGCALAEFSVTPGTVTTGSLTLPHYQRTITLRFLDQAGQPVPYLLQNELHGAPRVDTELENDLPRHTFGGPRAALRDPPGIDPGSWNGGSGASSSDYRHLPAGKIPLTDGKLSLTVFAGVSNTITIPLLPEIWGRETLTIMDATFTGPEWDDYVVNLELAPDFLEKLNAKREEYDVYPVIQPKDIGVRKPYTRRFKVRADPADIPPKPDLRDVSKLAPDYCRLLLRCLGREGLFPIVDSTSHKERFLGAPNPDNLWVFEFPATSVVKVVWSDGRLLSSQPQTIELAGARLNETTHAVNEHPVSCHTRMPSPTLAAQCIDLQLNTLSATAQATLCVEPGMPLADSHLSPPGANVFGGRRQAAYATRADDFFVFEGSVDDAMASAMDKQTVWRLRGWGAGRRDKDFYALRLNSTLTRGIEPLELLATTKGTGSLQPTLQPLRPLLALRAVGTTCGGLPWVQGVVVSYEQDEFNRAMRRRIVSQEIQPALGEKDAAGKYLSSAHFKQTTDSDEALRALMGEANYDAFDSRSQREFFFRHGTWYDTQLTVASDSHGYIAADYADIKPGKRYVLYLWSNSRDDIKPDLRIDFIASEGCTDLGAVILPEYR